MRRRFQTLLSKSTCAASAGPARRDGGGDGGRGLHSSTFRLNVSAFCGTGSPSHLRNFVETAPTLQSYGQFAQGSGAFDLPIRKLSYEQFVLGSALADFVIWPYESGGPSRRNFVDSWD